LQLFSTTHYIAPYISTPSKERTTPLSYLFLFPPSTPYPYPTPPPGTLNNGVDNDDPFNAFPVFSFPPTSLKDINTGSNRVPINVFFTYSKNGALGNVTA
jgi:hypothetical protein